MLEGTRVRVTLPNTAAEPFPGDTSYEFHAEAVMKRFVVFGFVAVLLGSSTGCGGGVDGLAKEQISLTNQLAE